MTPTEAKWISMRAFDPAEIEANIMALVERTGEDPQVYIDEQVAAAKEMLGFDDDAALIAGLADGTLKTAAQREAERAPVPAPIPASISDRQFAQQLAVLGMITREEAIAWVARGEIPAQLAGFVAAMPEEQRFDAEMLLAGATTFERGHPVTAAFGAAAGMSPDEIDDLWRAAAAL